MYTISFGIQPRVLGTYHDPYSNALMNLLYIVYLNQNSWYFPFIVFSCVRVCVRVHVCLRVYVFARVCVLGGGGVQLMLSFVQELKFSLKFC